MVPTARPPEVRRQLDRLWDRYERHNLGCLPTSMRTLGFSDVSCHCNPDNRPRIFQPGEIETPRRLRPSQAFLCMHCPALPMSLSTSPCALDTYVHTRMQLLGNTRSEAKVIPPPPICRNQPFGEPPSNTPEIGLSRLIKGRFPAQVPNDPRSGLRARPLDRTPVRDARSRHPRRTRQTYATTPQVIARFGDRGTVGG